LYGSAKSRNPARSAAIQRAFLNRDVSLPFDDVAAEQYAPVRAALESAGRPIGAYDLLIASIALAHGLTVVTHNVARFSRVPGLSVEDWE
jgi:tRNA(fMet)-specific endonuclease VapC